LGQQALASYEREGVLKVTLEGEVVSLGPDDLQVFAEGIEGWLVGREEGVTVALDTHITEALRHEGLARESINRIQNLRKQAGFEVTDRVEIEYHATEDLAAAMDSHRHWIGTEVLALMLELSADPSGEEGEHYVFGGGKLVLGLRRIKR